jgi:hypothetical protein
MSILNFHYLKDGFLDLFKVKPSLVESLACPDYDKTITSNFWAKSRASYI